MDVINSVYGYLRRRWRGVLGAVLIYAAAILQPSSVLLFSLLLLGGIDLYARQVMRDDADGQ